MDGRSTVGSKDWELKQQTHYTQKEEWLKPQTEQEKKTACFVR